MVAITKSYTEEQKQVIKEVLESFLVRPCGTYANIVFNEKKNQKFIDKAESLGIDIKVPDE